MAVYAAKLEWYDEDWTSDMNGMAIRWLLPE